MVLKDGKMNTNVAGDYNMKVGGDIQFRCKRQFRMKQSVNDKTSNTTGSHS